MKKTHPQNSKYEHRGVAPIIATLLMVAIAVVGGILIFVFAQGFFQDSSIQSPGVESVEIIGYDARDDGTLLETHDGTVLTGNAADETLTDTDYIVVYVRNKGVKDVIIDRVKLFGETYDVDNSGVDLTVAGSLEGTFCVLNTGTDCNTTGAIPSGADATVAIGYDSDGSVSTPGTGNGDKKLGRPLHINLVTGNGNVFAIQVTNGGSALVG